MRTRWSIGVAAAAMVVLSASAALAQAQQGQTDTFTVVGTIRVGGTLVSANIPLAHNVQFSTPADTYWKIEVQPAATGAVAYHVLLGPHFDAPAGSVGTAIIREIGSQELAVLDGVGYFVGQHPYGGSQGGSGSGTGTAFVVQGRPGGAADRFIFLEGDDLTVCKYGDTSNAKTIQSINDYLEVADNANPSGATIRKVEDLDATDPVRQMLWKIVDLAGKAGLDRPVPYGR